MTSWRDGFVSGASFVGKVRIVDMEDELKSTIPKPGNEDKNGEEHAISLLEQYVNMKCGDHGCVPYISENMEPENLSNCLRFWVSSRLWWL
jgi:hypothetical protein